MVVTDGLRQTGWPLSVDGTPCNSNKCMGEDREYVFCATFLGEIRSDGYTCLTCGTRASFCDNLLEFEEKELIEVDTCPINNAALLKRIKQSIEENGTLTKEEQRTSVELARKLRKLKNKQKKAKGGERKRQLLENSIVSHQVKPQHLFTQLTFDGWYLAENGLMVKYAGTYTFLEQSEEKFDTVVYTALCRLSSGADNEIDDIIGEYEGVIALYGLEELSSIIENEMIEKTGVFKKILGV